MPLLEAISSSALRIILRLGLQHLSVLADLVTPMEVALRPRLEALAQAFIMQLPGPGRELRPDSYIKAL